MPDRPDPAPPRPEKGAKGAKAARDALDESTARRKARDAAKTFAPPETGGRDGPDPARYGDWEKNGVASDF